MAVQLFFIISGFYISMVLSEKYSSIKIFYISRWLRISIPYYFVLLVLLILSIISGLVFDRWFAISAFISDPLAVNGTIGFLFSSMSNITIFFQDWTLFLSHEHGKSFSITSNFSVEDIPLHRYLLIAPAWSVGLELTFYVLAPFINRLRTRNLIIMILLSMAARIITYHFLELQHDPWTYRFFPFELAQFLLGMVGWRLYVKFDFKSKIPTRTANWHLIISYLILIIGLYLHLQILYILSIYFTYTYAVITSYLITPLIIPIIFAHFRKYPFDRTLGDLSYPIYLIHISVFEALSVLKPYMINHDHFINRLGALATIIIAIILYKFFLKPFEHWRYRFVYHNK